MKKIIDNIIGLKRYFALSLWYKEPPLSKLFADTDGLKAFGKLGLEHQADLMMMIAAIEYEYGRETNYTKEEMAAFKMALGRVMKFFIKAGSEYDEYMAEQAVKKQIIDKTISRVANFLYFMRTIKIYTALYCMLKV